MERLVPVATTLVAGAMGAVVFAVLGVPAAFLTGGAIGVAVLVVSGVRTAMPRTLYTPGLAIVGMMMGSAVKPETLSALTAMPLAVAGLVVAVSGATVASYLVLRKIGGWDRVSAYCGSIPGALQVTLAVAADAGAQMDKVVLAQGLRLFILVALVPLVFGGPGDRTLDSLDPDGGTLADVVISLAIGAAAAALGLRMRFPSAALVVPLGVSAFLSGAGLLTISIPPLLGAAAFMVMGASVATRFAGSSRQNILSILGVSLCAFVAAAGASLMAAAVVAHLLAKPLGTVFLAYAPGGVEAMIALAFLLQFDVAVVAVLHITRLILLSFAAPFLLTRVTRRAGAPDQSPSAR
ncbi:MAG: AbrB family transcriptional regulator [Pseudomonadota bacterium]